MLALRPLIALFIKDLVQDSVKEVAKKEIDKTAVETIRKEFLRTVAEGYTKEVTHNLSQYVRSLGQASVTIEVEGDLDGDRLFQSLQSSLRYLEVELENLGPESPVVKYLQRKYGGGSPETLVGLEPISVASMIADGDARPEPWLNRDTEFNKLMSIQAAELLDQLLQDELP
jgi:hypothetical protein